MYYLLLHTFLLSLFFSQQFGNFSFGTFIFTICVIVSNLKVRVDRELRSILRCPLCAYIPDKREAKGNWCGFSLWTNVAWQVQFKDYMEARNCQ